MRFLCYGTVAGGFLSDAWLDRAEPATLENRSLVKYLLVIEDFGGWALFQELLRTLRMIADRHATDIASVATRHVLGLPLVAGAIVGVRNRAHVAPIGRCSTLPLMPPMRPPSTPFCGVHPRWTATRMRWNVDRDGRHGRIMKYDLGDAPTPVAPLPITDRKPR